MFKFMKISSFFALICATGFSSIALAADIAAGEKKAAEVCAACHGKDGNAATDQYPKIGGQHKDYLAHALKGYKEGTRKNAIMAGFAAALTKQDIENLSLYYSKQSSVLHTRY
jgi:cytochrome c553